MEMIAWISVEDKKKLLKSFKPENSLWVVSDIKSRDFIIKQVKQKESVVRAKDLWRKSLLLNHPDITIVSRTFLISLYEEWARYRKEEWQRGQETGALLCQYMERTAHLLEHPLKESLINEWLSEKSENLNKTATQKTSNKSALFKWQSLSGEFWNYLNPPESPLTRKVIEESWISAFLIDNFPYSYFKQKEIVFDLGFEMDPLEGELILQIAEKIKTKVLVPFLKGAASKAPSSSVEDRKAEFHALSFKPTRDNKKFPAHYPAFFLKNPSFVPPYTYIKSSPKVQIKRWTTPLAEVKDISAYVGALLRKGVPAHKISVLAPQIEDYWVFLKSHFEQEKIPVQKRVTTPLISFYETQVWLSAMWTHLSVIRYENMEALWAKKDPYQNFNRLKANFYNVQEIKHWPSKLYKESLLRDKNQRVGGEEFIKWALALLQGLDRRKGDRLCVGGEAKIFDLLKKSLKEEFTKDLFSKKPVYIGSPTKDFRPSHSTDNKGLPSLSPPTWGAWLKLLKSFLRRKDLLLKKEESQGINCLSFNAISNLETDFVYMAGLSEQNLKSRSMAMLSLNEADFLTQSLGFIIKWEPVDKMEQMLSHFVHQEREEVILSFADSNFEGLPLSPAFFWLKKAKAQGQNLQVFSTVNKSLWEKRKEKPVLKDILQPLNISPARISCIEQSLAEDQGKKKPSDFFENKVEKLTPSLLEDYTHCPFIFFAKKHLNLWDGPEQDMDMPALERGILIHKLFESLILETSNKEEEMSRASISELLEDLYVKQIKSLSQTSPGESYESIKKLHPLIWEKEKSYLIKKALIFLKKEKEIRKIFKDFKPLACEKKYHCYWNLKTKNLSLKGDIAFEGKIDRIDTNQQAYHVMDYKARLSSGSSAPAWLEREMFQMAVYAQAVELGLADLPALPVLSALYVSYKDFSRQGMALKEPDYIQLLGSPRKKSLLSKEEKQDIFKKINQQIQKIILSMQAGHFPAQPKDKKLCKTCRWQKICRAPHLN